MAKIIGESGHTAAEQAIRHYRRSLLYTLLGIASLSMVLGCVLCLSILGKAIPFWGAFAGFFLIGGAIFWLFHFINHKSDQHERERINWRKGALGEAAVGLILEGLPDSFVVFNDIGTQSGNIDHVVVGPTGIFVIDTKNWRGLITPDPRGELLCNGHSTGRNEVKALLRSIMVLREKINVLTRRDDFVQGMLAFPLARVEARWGTTRNVHCVTDDRILDYIQNYNFSRRLKKEEIELIEKAFHALAGMGSGFDPAEGGLTMIPSSR